MQLPIVIFKKSTLSDMYHCETYLFINFQQTRVSRPVKTVHTNLFAKTGTGKITPFGHALPPNGHSDQF